MKAFIALLLCLFVFVNANNITTASGVEGLEFLPNFLPKFAGPKYCATEDIWAWKKAVHAAKTGKAVVPCKAEGNCDYIDVRNRWINKRMDISLYITVLCSTATSCPGAMTLQKVEAQLKQINDDFKGVGGYYDTGITFQARQIAFVVDSQYATIPAYSQFNSAWYTALINLKNRHAVNPLEYLNVFVTGQTAGSQGTLLGIGTFPWDPEATQATGGLWVNANYFGAGQKTATHEIGHNIGLWHTFHGTEEVSCNNVCYEVVHADTSNTGPSNEVGDFCADTPSQPMNYNCQYPTGSDCRGTRYNSIGNVPSLINNFLAYTPDNCYTTFTAQQSMRSHCWVCERLRRWVPNSECTA